MSYINDALRKAQKNKDNRYEPFGDVIAAAPERPNRLGRGRLLWGTIAAAAVLLSVVLVALDGLPPFPAWRKGALPATVAQKPAPNTSETLGKSPAVPAVREVVVREEYVPAIVMQKPVPKDSETAGKPPVAPVVREADVRYQEALVAQRKGNLPGAEALYGKVLALDSGHVQALNNLGVIYMAQKRREKAIALFSRAVVLKKDYVDPYYNLACLYAQTNEIDESLWYLKVAVAIDGGVINWVKKDADMINVVASPEFKKIMEGQKN